MYDNSEHAVNFSSDSSLHRIAETNDALALLAKDAYIHMYIRKAQYLVNTHSSAFVQLLG